MVKNLPANAGDSRDMSVIPQLRAYSREGNDNLLQYSCLEHFTDRGTWCATVHGVAKSWTQLSKPSACLKAGYHEALEDIRSIKSDLKMNKWKTEIKPNSTNWEILIKLSK